MVYRPNDCMSWSNKNEFNIFSNDIQESANNMRVPAADDATQQWKQTRI